MAMAVAIVENRESEKSESVPALDGKGYGRRGCAVSAAHPHVGQPRGGPETALSHKAVNLLSSWLQRAWSNTPFERERKTRMESAGRCCSTSS